MNTNREKISLSKECPEELLPVDLSEAPKDETEEPEVGQLEALGEKVIGLEEKMEALEAKGRTGTLNSYQPVAIRINSKLLGKNVQRGIENGDYDTGKVAANIAKLMSWSIQRFYCAYASFDEIVLITYPADGPGDVVWYKGVSGTIASAASSIATQAYLMEYATDAPAIAGAPFVAHAFNIPEWSINKYMGWRQSKAKSRLLNKIGKAYLKQGDLNYNQMLERLIIECDFDFDSFYEENGAGNIIYRHNFKEDVAPAERPAPRFRPEPLVARAPQFRVENCYISSHCGPLNFGQKEEWESQQQ